MNAEKMRMKESEGRGDEGLENAERKKRELLKMYEIWVRNPRTKEELLFLGQGVRVEEAVSDGVKGLKEYVTVRLATGERRVRLKFRFEEDLPFVSDAEEKRAEEEYLLAKQRKKELEEKEKEEARAKLYRWLRTGKG